MNALSPLALSLALLLVAGADAQTPAPTSFGYQVYLVHQGEPLDEPADLRFTLWDDGEEGVQIGPTVALDAVEVANGLASVELDFGLAAFAAGEARWLEIEVATPADIGAFERLAPRRLLTAVPVAAFALSGNEGPQGEQGPQGERGPQGDQGPPGVIGPNTVGSGEVVDGSLTGADIANDSLTGADIRNLSGADIADGSLTGADIANNSLTGADIRNLSGADITDGSLTGSDIADSSLTGADIINNSLTSADVEGLTGADITDGSIRSVDIASIAPRQVSPRPFEFERFDVGGSGTIQTRWPAGTWVVAVVGFHTRNGDIQENGVGDPIFVFPFISGGRWQIRFDLRSHNTNETWRVWAMAVHRDMSVLHGGYGNP